MAILNNPMMVDDARGYGPAGDHGACVLRVRHVTMRTKGAIPEESRDGKLAGGEDILFPRSSST